MEVLQRTANRGSISTGSYEIGNSVKLEADNSENFTRTPSSNTNRQTFTFSTWVKRTELGINGGLIEAYQDGSNFFLFAFTTGDQIVVYNIDSSVDYGYVYTPVFRDTSAWYHIVLVSDTTNSTASDRYQLYVNGVRITDISQDYGTPPQNYNNNLNSTIAHNIGKRADGNSYNCCYLAETHLVDGTALAPTAFGEVDSASGIWKPIDASPTYGTNGFYLDYADAADLGDDESGNGNDYTENNIAAADQATDTPTNNFCTWLPLWTYTNMATIGNGGTSSIGGGGSVWRGAKGSMGVSKGKWYWEQKASGSDTIVGWQTDNCISASGSNSHNVLDTVSFYEGGNFLWIKDSTSGRNADSASGTHANGQIVGCALNLDSDPQTVTFYRNGSAIISDRNIDGLANKTLFPQTSHYNQTSDANFGGYTNFTISSAASDANGYGTFEYAPPSGYYALCTKNLAEYG